MRILISTALVLTAFALPACGGDDDSAGDTGPQTAGLAMGPGISIEEAIAFDSDEPVLVNGNLLAQGDDVRLCSALAESFPPQCGGASLVIEGLQLEEVDGLVSEGDVSWTDRPIQLLGVVSDGTLTVSENATA